MPVCTGQQPALFRNSGRRGCGLFRSRREDHADDGVRPGRVTPWHHDSRTRVMARSVLRVVQGHDTCSHADVTDRDRDESSRRARGAWVRTNPQTQVRRGARRRAPILHWRVAPKVQGGCGCVVISTRTHGIQARSVRCHPVWKASLVAFMTLRHTSRGRPTTSSADRGIELDAAGCGSTRSFERRIGGCARTFPLTCSKADLLSLLTAPVIYSLLLPLVLVDLWVTLYQSICFPVYGMARVPRRRYFAVDRHKLAYLNGIEKVNCTFCSYANGLIEYVREVAGRTEQYWCPIKHARAGPVSHQRYHGFLDYGDASGYRDGLPALRDAMRARPRHGAGKRRKAIGHVHGGRRADASSTTTGSARKQLLGIMRRGSTPAETLVPWEEPCLPLHHTL